MIRWTSTVLVLVAAGTMGCSEAPVLRKSPSNVSGKVSQGGKPVSNVAVFFQPLDHGHPKSLPVTPQGTFQGELIDGNYTYYVGPSTAANSVAALRKIDPKYLEPDMRRTVSVEFGKELVLALD